MTVLLELLPWMAAMLLLAAVSAFFSASEAAFFSLRSPQRRRLSRGTATQRLAAHLLEKPDQLPTAVLFGNLVINIAYFAVASLAEFDLQRRPHTPTSLRIGLPFAALLALILLSEMLPKSLGVLASSQLATAFSLPLALMVRLMQPFMPVLQAVSVLSRRLLWPKFQAEAYLAVADLERAIELSSADASLIEQERAALHGIVGLAELRVDECMRPRNQLAVHRPPVDLRDLDLSSLTGGYVLISEEDSNEIASAVHLNAGWQLSGSPLQREAEPVVYCPWCVSVAEALQQLLNNDREVVAVINELGETIGVLTMEDILDIAFSSRPGRSERLFNRPPIRPLGNGRWVVEGLANLRRVADYFQVELPPTHSVTVAGIVQERLQRLPQRGDQCTWGPFHPEVIQADPSGSILVSLQLVTPTEDQP